jgi:hypothetical protein
VLYKIYKVEPKGEGGDILYNTDANFKDDQIYFNGYFGPLEWSAH